jgi:hypothetical protein
MHAPEGATAIVLSGSTFQHSSSLSSSPPSSSSSLDSDDSSSLYSKHGATLLVVWAAHNLILPLRVAATAMLTPWVARRLRALGFESWLKSRWERMGFSGGYGGGGSGTGNGVGGAKNGGQKRGF